MKATYAGTPLIVTWTPSREAGRFPPAKLLHESVVVARFDPKIETNVADAMVGWALAALNTPVTAGAAEATTAIAPARRKRLSMRIGHPRLRVLPGRSAYGCFSVIWSILPVPS